MSSPSARASETTRLALAEGCRRFDAAHFFDAHDAWEDAWRVESGQVRQLLHGLIKIAAGFHKGLMQGRPAGMAKLIAAGLDLVDGVGGMGLVELEGFRSQVSEWLGAAQRWADGGGRPELPLPRFRAVGS